MILRPALCKRATALSNSTTDSVAKSEGAEDRGLRPLFGSWKLPHRHRVNGADKPGPKEPPLVMPKRPELDASVNCADLVPQKFVCLSTLHRDSYLKRSRFDDLTARSILQEPTRFGLMTVGGGGRPRRCANRRGAA